MATIYACLSGYDANVIVATRNISREVKLMKL